MYTCFRCRNELKRNPRLEIKVQNYDSGRAKRLYCRKCTAVIRKRLSTYIYGEYFDTQAGPWHIMSLDADAYDATIMADKHKPECANYYLWNMYREVT